MLRGCNALHDRRRTAQLRAYAKPSSAMRLAGAGLNLRRFHDGLIFGPRRAFGCEVFDLGVAQLHAHRGHDLS